MKENMEEWKDGEEKGRGGKKRTFNLDTNIFFTGKTPLMTAVYLETLRMSSTQQGFRGVVRDTLLTDKSSPARDKL